jgi:hypothetical protein
MVIWYLFPNLVCLDKEKSGNPGQVDRRDNTYLLTLKRARAAVEARSC